MFKGFVPVSLEYALVKDPDIIFVITHEGGISPVADNTLLLHPAWKGLRAVQAGNVIKLPFATFGINLQYVQEMQLKNLQNLCTETKYDEYRDAV